MLSSDIMRLLIPLRILTVLLLSAFLLTSVGNVFGYAWCVGEDGHVEVNYVNDEGCCDDDYNDRLSNKPGMTAISSFDGELCGLCLDFSTQPGEAVFFKRLKRTPTVSIASFPLSGLPSTLIKGPKRSVGGVSPQTPPRVSMAILAHRTVVLLN